MRVLGFLLMLFRSFLGLALLTPLLLLTIPFWLVKGLYLGLLKLNGYGKNPTRWNEIIEYDPEIGWKPKANVDAHYLDQVGNLCSIKTCSEGWPGTVTLDDAEAFVIGDSYAFGYGARYADSYMARLNGLRVKPLAAPGYNMVQGLLLLRKYRPLLKGKVVFWFICLENDLVENLSPVHPTRLRIPCLQRDSENGRWSVFTGHLNEGLWPFRVPVERFSNLLPFLFTEGEFSDRLYSAAEYLLGEATRICGAEGARLVVLTIPLKAQLAATGMDRMRKRLGASVKLMSEYPDVRFRGICENLGIPYYSGREELTSRDFKRNDSHWNPSGNAKIAALISQVHSELAERTSSSAAG